MAHAVGWLGGLRGLVPRIQAFSLFAKTDKDCITLDDLKQVAEELGESMTQQEYALVALRLLIGLLFAFGRLWAVGCGLPTLLHPVAACFVCSGIALALTAP